MKAFVIGGEGFIGSHICRKFLQEGARVSVFGLRPETSLLADVETRLERWEGDIRDADSLERGIRQFQPDVIIHLAAFGVGKDGLARAAQLLPEKALEVNVKGYFHVLEAARNCGCSRIVWAGSSTVYDVQEKYEGGRVNEQSPLNPSTFYGMTKVIDEVISRYYRKQYGMEIVGIRLPLVYGPGRWYKGAGAAIVDIFEKSLSGEKTVIRGGDEKLDLMYVKDVADVFYHVSVTQYPLSECYNVKSHTTSLPELVSVVRELVPSADIVFEAEASPVIYPLMDTSRIERELGYRPRYDVRQACQDYLETLRREKC